MLFLSAMTILGAQLVQFAVLVRWIATVSQMAPEPAWVVRAKRFASVEAGLITGIVLFGAGVLWSASLLSSWQDAGYPALRPEITMRSVIPAVTMMVLGVQAAAGSLLAGALQLAWKTSSKT